MKTLLVTIALFSFCTQYYPERFANVTQYAISSSLETPKGIRVDPGHHQVDLAKIDRYVDELEACIGKAIKRDAFAVKFPDDLYISPCTGEELFPCKMPVDVCIKKVVDNHVQLIPGSPCTLDELPCLPCPCHCRAAIQANAAVITNTKMNLFKAELTRLVTGVNNPWENNYLAKCLR